MIEVGPPLQMVYTGKKTMENGRVMESFEVVEDTRPVEIGSFRYDYFPWSIPLQALIAKEKMLYGLPKNFSVNEPLFKPVIAKMYADWKREANKSFDPIRNKFPVEIEDE